MDNATNSSSNSTFEGWQAQQPKSFWTNLSLPILYLAILIGSLYTFSSLYRKRQIARKAKLESWFPPHHARDIYLSLLHLDPAEASTGGDGEKKLNKVPDSILKAALQRRALEDVRRIIQLRSSKQALESLLQRGSVGDELWQRFLRAEQEIEEEVKDVVNEANAFAQGWGQVIFQSANEMNTNDLIKARIAEIQAQTQVDKEWWEKKRAGIQSDFMKELEDDGNAKSADTGQRKAGSNEDAVIVEAGGPASAQGEAKKRKARK